MKILVVIILAFSGETFAGGGQIGNGADAVVCTRGFKITAELLDIFEARLRKKTWNFEDYNGASKEVAAFRGADELIAQLDTLLPVKSARLRRYLSKFFEEREILDGVILTDIPDSLNLAIPAGCRLGQLVIQIGRAHV